MSNQLEKGVYRYVDTKVENAPDCRIMGGVIKASTLTGYTVTIGNIDYTNVPTLSATSHVAYDTVKVMIPNNEYSNMFILGKTKLV